MSGKSYEFADMFGKAFIIRNNLEGIIDKKIPLRILTDSKLLFDYVTKGRKVNENLFLIDTEAVREA